MAVVLTELRTELDTDPTGLGYAPFIPGGNLTALADLVNTLTDIDIDKLSISNFDVINALDYTEVNSLASPEREALTILTQPDRIPVSSNTKNAFAAIFAAGTNSRANLQAISRKKATRAEILFGANVTVTSGQIGDALAL